jgi:hypothetical protein|tara:strand:+ start:164 stop:298 length:135 start_codon:yes stop_codon:yes gene_type:complete
MLLGLIAVKEFSLLVLGAVEVVERTITLEVAVVEEELAVLETLG